MSCEYTERVNIIHISFVNMNIKCDSNKDTFF